MEEYQKDKNILVGRSTHNKAVTIEGGRADLVGMLAPVKINDAFPSSLRGSLVSKDNSN